jgi:hypothetical protein
MFRRIFTITFLEMHYNLLNSLFVRLTIEMFTEDFETKILYAFLFY